MALGSNVAAAELHCAGREVDMRVSKLALLVPTVAVAGESDKMGR